MRISPIGSLKWAGSTYVTLIRNTPLTVIMVFAILVLWPKLGVQFSGNYTTNFFWLAVVALSVYHAAFFCEALRSGRSEEHTSELQSRGHLVCRLLLEKKKECSHHV